MNLTLFLQILVVFVSSDVGIGLLGVWVGQVQ